MRLLLLPFKSNCQHSANPLQVVAARNEDNIRLDFERSYARARPRTYLLG